MEPIQPGDLYLEVGCLWGGSAILAAHKAARVITVDFMRGGYWDKGDPGADMLPVTAEAVLDNLAYFVVAHKVHVIKANTHPWPLPAYIEPDVMLVDAGHSYEAAKHDWIVASNIAKRAILVHDYHRARQHAGVVEMVEEIAMKDERWKFDAHEQTMARFVRADDTQS